MKIPSLMDGCVFAYDFGAGLTDGSLYRDLGPNGLDLTPVNFVAPSFGLVQDPSGATCLRFNGTTQYAYMAAAAAARFYAVAPGNGMTLAVVARYAGAVVGERLFTCRNAGATRGLQLRRSTAERWDIYAYDNTGVAAVVFDSADVPLSGRTCISALALDQAGVRGQTWHDGSGRAAGVGGSVLPAAYDAAVLPQVGAAIGPGSYFGGDLYFAGLWNRPWTLAEYKAWHAYWADRT